MEMNSIAVASAMILRAGAEWIEACRYWLAEADRRPLAVSQRVGGSAEQTSTVATCVSVR